LEIHGYRPAVVGDASCRACVALAQSREREIKGRHRFAPARTAATPFDRAESTGSEVALLTADR